MEQVNNLLRMLSNNLLLVSIAAVLFFGVKALAGYLTYKHYNRKFHTLDRKLDELLGREHKKASEPSLFIAPRSPEDS